jgi:hypothetical protein
MAGLVQDKPGDDGVWVKLPGMTHWALLPARKAAVRSKEWTRVSTPARSTALR